MFSQATTHQLVPSNHVNLTVDDIEPALQLGSNIHIAPTKLITLENTLSGMIFPQDEVVRIGELARKHGIAMHLDGARIWNVAAVEIEQRGLDARKDEDLRVVSVLLYRAALRCIDDAWQNDGAARAIRYCITVPFQGYRRTYRLVCGTVYSLNDFTDSHGLVVPSSEQKNSLRAPNGSAKRSEEVFVNLGRWQLQQTMQ